MVAATIAAGVTEQSGMVWGIGVIAELLELKVGTWRNIERGSPSERPVGRNGGGGERVEGYSRQVGVRRIGLFFFFLHSQMYASGGMCSDCKSSADGALSLQ